MRSKNVHGYGSASATMAGRTAENFAAFFTPFLEIHDQLLDVGCGPGTITCGLAGLVAPGTTIGVDIGQSEVDKAAQLAEEKGLQNITFKVADSVNLPFDDGSFDRVFSCAMLEHMDDPNSALSEIKRVLRPGGIVGLKGGMRSAHVAADMPGENWRRAREIYTSVWSSQGGNQDMGMDQISLLDTLGFERMQVTGTFETRGAESLADYAKRLVAPEFVESAERLSISDRNELENLSRHISDEQPENYFVLVAWLEVVGRLPG